MLNEAKGGYIEAGVTHGTLDPSMGMGNIIDTSLVWKDDAGNTYHVSPLKSGVSRDILLGVAKSMDPKFSEDRLEKNPVGNIVPPSAGGSPVQPVRNLRSGTRGRNPSRSVRAWRAAIPGARRSSPRCGCRSAARPSRSCRRRCRSGCGGGCRAPASSSAPASRASAPSESIMSTLRSSNSSGVPAGFARNASPLASSAGSHVSAARDVRRRRTDPAIAAVGAREVEPRPAHVPDELVDAPRLFALAGCRRPAVGRRWQAPRCRASRACSRRRSSEGTRKWK